MNEHDDLLGAQLRDERPQMDLDELEATRRRALGVTSAAPSRMRRARLSIVALLAGGLVLSGAGAGLAIDGISSSRDASVAQYGTQAVDSAGVESESQAGGEEGEEQGDAPTLGATRPKAGAADAPTQVAESGGELPFTGYAGMVVLLAGLVALGSGLVLRRGTRAGTAL